jgi:hypothetical protein
VASRTKKRASSDTNIRFDCDLGEAENSNVVADPGMIANGEAPREGDIYVAAETHSFPNPGTEGAEQGTAEARAPGTEVHKKTQRTTTHNPRFHFGAPRSKP